MISFGWRERDVHSVAARDGVAVDGVAADGVAADGVAGADSVVAREGNGMHRRSTCLLVMISFGVRDVHRTVSRPATPSAATADAVGRDSVIS